MNTLDITQYLIQRKKDVEKCYDNLIKPYTLYTDDGISVGVCISYMKKKEKEEFINQRNCLFVQKEVYAEILEFIDEHISKNEQTVTNGDKVRQMDNQELVNFIINDVPNIIGDYTDSTQGLIKYLESCV